MRGLIGFLTAIEMMLSAFAPVLTQFRNRVAPRPAANPGATRPIKMDGVLASPAPE
jgi:hypothetical protein